MGCIVQGGWEEGRDLLNERLVQVMQVEGLSFYIINKKSVIVDQVDELNITLIRQKVY